MNVEMVRGILAHKAGQNRSAFARENGLSPSYVNEVIGGSREPGEKVLKVLGLEKVVSYRKAKEDGRV